MQQLTGHRRLESLQEYHIASLEQQKTMSEIVSDNNLPKASSSAPISSIPLEIEDQLLADWDPLIGANVPIPNLMPNAHSSNITSPFQGALISNCTFNLNFYNSSPHQQINSNKRNRYLFIDSDDDE